jgi:alkylglycerol monooxygenase
MRAGEYTGKAVDARAIALAVPFFLLTILVEMTIDARRKDPATGGPVAGARRWYRFPDSITSLACGVGQQVLAVLAIGTIQVGAYTLIYEKGRLLTLDPASPLVWVLGFVLLDLGYYAYHRASHRINVLWAMHVVHHQSEEYNLSTALRQSWFTAIFSWVFYAPMAIAGFPPLVYVLCLTGNTLYQYWIHNRGVGRLGPLEWVMNTPSHHRVHHGIDPEYIDKNYAGVFIVWDRMFGTFTAEDREPAYGTVKPLASFNPFWANVEGFARIVDIARRTGRPLDKLRAWVAPPEWMPDDLGGPVTVPPVDHERRVKFDVPGWRGLVGYVGAQFAAVAVAVGFLNWFSAQLPTGLKVLAVAVLMSALATWGGLFERRGWAVPLELARLVATVALAWLLPLGALTLPVCAGAAAYAVASAVALTVVTRRSLALAAEPARGTGVA